MKVIKSCSCFRDFIWAKKCRNAPQRFEELCWWIKTFWQELRPGHTSKLHSEINQYVAEIFDSRRLVIWGPHRRESQWRYQALSEEARVKEFGSWKKSSKLRLFCCDFLFSWKCISSAELLMFVWWRRPWWSSWMSCAADLQLQCFYFLCSDSSDWRSQAKLNSLLFHAIVHPQSGCCLMWYMCGLSV